LTAFGRSIVPGSDGVYSIFGGAGVRANDDAFAHAYREAQGLKRRSGSPAPPPDGSVSVAVLDSGVVVGEEDYFRDRVAQSVSALGGVGVQLTRGRPATTGQHGSHVASIAASGTAMIKIIDVQVGSTQEGGKVEPAVWRTAFKWAIEQRARIVNVSVICPWSMPEIKSIVSNNTGVLFLATSGNASVEFDTAYRTECGFDQGNVILVSGCKRDGGRHNQRGFGAGIDLFVPSLAMPGLVSKTFAQQHYFAKASADRDREDRKLDPDRVRIASIQEKLGAAPEDQRLKTQLAREQKRLEMGVQRLPWLPASAAEYPVNDLAQRIEDDGVSFGIPMVANVAAKMMLIMPTLTPREIIAIMKATAEQCEAGPVLDPTHCYEAALARRRDWVARL
jgi:hypothetical protein